VTAAPAWNSLHGLLWTIVTFVVLSTRHPAISTPEQGVRPTRHVVILTDAAEITLGIERMAEREMHVEKTLLMRC
jgi:hypothetical protein